MAPTRRVTRRTPRGRNLASAACCVAAPGAAIRGTAARRFGTGTFLSSGTPSPVSVWCFPLDPDYNLLFYHVTICGFRASGFGFLWPPPAAPEFSGDLRPKGERAGADSGGRPSRAAAEIGGWGSVASAACCVAAPGTAIRGTAARRIGTGTILRTGTTTPVSVWCFPQHPLSEGVCPGPRGPRQRKDLGSRSRPRLGEPSAFVVPPSGGLRFASWLIGQNAECPGRGW